MNKRSSGPSKRKKCLPSCNNKLFLKLAEDTQFSEAMDSAERVLVGQVRSRHYGVEHLQKWTMEVWGHHLSEPPRIQTFVRGWFALRFRIIAQTNWVLTTIWHIDQALVLFRRWTPLFDPEIEKAGTRPV